MNPNLSIHEIEKLLTERKAELQSALGKQKKIGQRIAEIDRAMRALKGEPRVVRRAPTHKASIVWEPAAPARAATRRSHARRPARKQGATDQIVSLLTKGKPRTPRDIARALRKSPFYVIRTLTALARKRVLRRSGKGRSVTYTVRRAP